MTPACYLPASRLAAGLCKWSGKVNHWTWVLWGWDTMAVVVFSTEGISSGGYRKTVGGKVCGGFVWFCFFLIFGKLCLSRGKLLSGVKSLVWVWVHVHEEGRKKYNEVFSVNKSWAASCLPWCGFRYLHSFQVQGLLWMLHCGCPLAWTLGTAQTCYVRKKNQAWRGCLYSLVTFTTFLNSSSHTSENYCWKSYLAQIPKCLWG